MDRTAVDDERERTSHAGRDLLRIARVRLAGDVGRGRGQRAEDGGEGPRGRVVGHADADGGGAAGEHAREPGAGTHGQDEREAAGPEPLTQYARRRPDHPQVGSLGGVGEQHRDGLLGRAALGGEQPLDGVRERHVRGDPVDGVRGHGHDPAGAQEANRLGAGGVTVREDPGIARAHAGARSAAPGPSRSRRISRAASARRVALRAASLGGARTSASIRTAAPSSSTGAAR